MVLSKLLQIIRYGKFPLEMSSSYQLLLWISIFHIEIQTNKQTLWKLIWTYSFRSTAVIFILFLLCEAEKKEISLQPIIVSHSKGLRNREIKLIITAGKLFNKKISFESKHRKRNKKKGKKIGIWNGFQVASNVNQFRNKYQQQNENIEKKIYSDFQLYIIAR